MRDITVASESKETDHVTNSQLVLTFILPMMLVVLVSYPALQLFRWLCGIAVEIYRFFFGG